MDHRARVRTHIHVKEFKPSPNAVFDLGTKKAEFYSACILVIFSFPAVLGSTARRGTIILSFQNMFAFHILQHGHLLDGYLVEFLETFALRHPFMDKDRI